MDARAVRAIVRGGCNLSRDLTASNAASSS
jgi:hypothetical protein